jgi:hypothetical protein
MTSCNEKRCQKRKNVNFPVTYICSNENSLSPRHGETFDLSDSGISFYTDTPLKEGLDINVQIPIWNSPRACTIKWRSKKGRNIYKMGLCFSQKNQ